MLKPEQTTQHIP